MLYLQVRSSPRKLFQILNEKKDKTDKVSFTSFRGPSTGESVSSSNCSIGIFANNDCF